MHLRRQRLEPPVADRLVAARVLLEVRDARDLEPDEEGGVVRDSLRVGLREAHRDVGREREALHGRDSRILECQLPHSQSSSGSDSRASS